MKTNCTDALHYKKQQQRMKHLRKSQMSGRINHFEIYTKPQQLEVELDGGMGCEHTPSLEDTIFLF